MISAARNYLVFLRRSVSLAFVGDWRYYAWMGALTVVDYDWCIGCRYCEAACPYWARRFNFAKPSIPKDRLNPEMAYLGNRPRKQGVMEKCHFCIQRTRMGKYPACLEVCPVGARKFGNILDPESEVSYILREKRVFIQLKEEMGTSPRFFYYFDV